MERRQIGRHLSEELQTEARGSGLSRRTPEAQLLHPVAMSFDEPIPIAFAGLDYCATRDLVGAVRPETLPLSSLTRQSPISQDCAAMPRDRRGAGAGC